ncbi:serum paraoxonase/arylesterase 2-like [Apostichopus japonicus]|uniref:serum paraoxonase/arylesterase 2-like n=1 Tax=Stichopus japonicus TaxID=307972 RepID=UPI003AB6F244
MIWKCVLLLVVAVVMQHCYKLALIMGYHKTVYAHWPGKCHSVHPVLQGSEDIALSEDNLAFISSGLRIQVCDLDGIDPRNNEFVGRIYLFDFNNPEAGASEMILPKGMMGPTFNPHGIDTWFDSATGRVYLFVVNHRADEETVELFTFDRKNSNNSLAHVRTYREPEFRSLNDVLAVSSEEFYVTNDGYFRNCWKTLEFLFLLKWSSIVHVTQEGGGEIVATGHALNSLGKSSGLVFATSPVGRFLNVYKRNDDGTLLLRHSIDVGTGIDNIFVHPHTMDLWFGAHPIGHAFLEHTTNLDTPAPSQVIRLHPTGEQDDPFSSVELFELFSDSGKLISASSSVAVSGNRLLIGSLLQKLVYCEMTVPN